MSRNERTPGKWLLKEGSGEGSALESHGGRRRKEAISDLVGDAPEVGQASNIHERQCAAGRCAVGQATIRGAQGGRSLRGGLLVVSAVGSATVAWVNES